MSGKRDEGRKAFKVMEGQIALLRNGSRATDYACREVLDLPLGCSPEDVVMALDRKIHRWERQDGDGGNDAVMLGYVTAAKQLLKGFAQR